MSDEWSDDAEAPRKKGGIPRWLWWTCGVGCTAVLLLVTVVVISSVVLFRKAQDPEAVIPQIQEYLPCEEWPAEYEPSGLVFWGYGMFTIEWPGGMMMLQPLGDREVLEENFNPDSSAAKLSEKDRTLGEMEIQGRTTRTLAFRQRGTDIEQMRIDLSGEVGPCSFLVLAVPEGEEIDTSSVDDFLLPFDVWHDED